MANDLTAATTGWACGLDAKEALRLNDLSLSATVLASIGLRAGFGSGTLATFASGSPADFDVFLAAKCGFDEIQLQGSLEIGTSGRSSSSSPATETKPFEEVSKGFEDVADITKPARTACACTRDTGVSELIVTLTFLTVAENFIGFSCGLEFFGRFLIARISIGMEFERQLLVRLLDFRGSGGLAHFKDFVVIAFGSHRNHFLSVMPGMSVEMRIEVAAATRVVCHVSGPCESPWRGRLRASHDWLVLVLPEHARSRTKRGNTEQSFLGRS